MERRFLDSGAAGLKLETRDGAANGLQGYAAVYASLSVDLGGFREEIAPGTFARVLAKNPDVRFTVEHDPAMVLGRSGAGTLLLEDTERGLLARVPELPATQVGRDIAVSVARGDVAFMSFGFHHAKDTWREETIEGRSTVVRTLTDFDLIDVAAVVTPAYRDTELNLRCAQESLERWISGKKIRRKSIYHTLLQLLAKKS